MNPSENVAVHGESIHLPPMWPGVKSRPQRHIMWVEFVVASVAFFQEVFLRVLRLSPLLKNRHF